MWILEQDYPYIPRSYLSISSLRGPKESLHMEFFTAIAPDHLTILESAPSGNQLGQGDHGDSSHKARLLSRETRRRQYVDTSSSIRLPQGGESTSRRVQKIHFRTSDKTCPDYDASLQLSLSHSRTNPKSIIFIPSDQRRAHTLTSSMHQLSQSTIHLSAVSYTDWW